VNTSVLRAALALTGLFAVVGVATTTPTTTLAFPHGLARMWPDLVGLAGQQPAVVAALMAVLVGLGTPTAFRAGRWGVAGAVALLLTAALHIAVLTAAQSRGAIHHGQQLLAQTLVALGATALWSVWRPHDLQTGRWPQRVVDIVTVVIASVYLGAGLRKLLATSGRWMLDAPLLVADIVKATRDHQVDAGLLVTGELPAGAALLVDHPGVVGVLFSCGLLLELAAPLALLGRLPAIAIGTLLVMFHRLAVGLMGLSFPYHEALLLVWCVGLPLWTWWQQERQR
jgi:hypothetical protein